MNAGYMTIDEAKRILRDELRRGEQEFVPGCSQEFADYLLALRTLVSAALPEGEYIKKSDLQTAIHGLYVVSMHEVIETDVQACIAAMDTFISPTKSFHTGKWEEYIDCGNVPHYTCSECKNESHRYDFCPFCGADMRG